MPRRFAIAGAGLVVLLVGVGAGCTGRTSHATTAATTVVTHPSGTDCRAAVAEAVRATFAASSFTVHQAAWQEHLGGPVVVGGGAATIVRQAPDRERVTPAASGSRDPVELVVVGRHWWQGSPRRGWVAFTTRTPSDPLQWVRVPERADAATSSGDSCRFTARVPEGRVSGAAVVADGHLARLGMTLRDGRTTILMRYTVDSVGSSPPVTTPR